MLAKYRHFVVFIILFILIAATAEFRVSNSEENVQQGRVIQPNEGDSFRLGNGIGTLKIDSTIGAENFAAATQLIEAGRGIRTHLHEKAEEFLFIIRGKGTGIVGEKRIPIEAGSIVYIPKGVWHGIESDGNEMDLLFVAAPPGHEAMWRELAAPIGQPQKVVTPEERLEIMKKYGMRFKQD